MTKVVFPCDQGTWWQVKDRLHRLKLLCEQEDVDLKTVAVEHQAVINISTGIGDFGSLEYRHSTFYHLAQFFIKRGTPLERNHFLQETLPGIIDLALKVESLLPTEGIAVSKQQNAETRLLERQLCCSVLACAFLCLIPDTHGLKLGRSINFSKFFSFLNVSSQMAKLRCILNFFDRVSGEYDTIEGNVSFTRLVVKRDELPTLDTWLNSSSTLCPVTVLHEGCIEDSCPEAIEVDFANKYIGGGTMGKGRVQEEIRFTVCPELIVSMLFMECMEENEAIIIKGYEQFAKTGGYASELMFIGNYKDMCQRDVDGFLKNTLCAIDAISYKNREGASCARQYQDHFVLRDLNKAFIGFSTPFIIPEEGNGKHTSDEDYFTADEEDTHKQDQLGAIDMFVDDLLREAITLALPEALTNQQEANDTMPTHSNHDNNQSNPPATEEVHMNHLEVNFRDWYAHYRRRSSNLSDLSSRRSSWDVASRRSSGCSMRGYSSEFSSEFEEYYDNFQMQDQKYKYHTIKEEVGTTLINDFASTLATSLLKQCTLEVSQLESGIQKFDDTRPSDVENPQPYRLNPILESHDSSPPSEMSGESKIRDFVDAFFETVWPFGTINERNQEIRDSMILRINSSKTDNGEFHISVNADKEDSNVDENYLYSVADRLVTQAIEEALIEYRYRYLHHPPVRNIGGQASTESSQSDHSFGTKDQSYSSKQAQTFDSQVDMSSCQSPAVAVAERVMSKLFDNKDELGTSILDTNNQICDISITSSQLPIHSSTNGSYLPTACSAYDRIANRIVSRGLTSANGQNSNRQKAKANSTDRTLLVAQSSSRGRGCCVTDYYQFCDMLGNHPSYVHSALACDSTSSQQESHNTNTNLNNSNYSSSSSSGRCSSSLTSDSSSHKSKYSGDKRRSSSRKSDDRSAINLSESSNTNSSDNDRNSKASSSGHGDSQLERKIGRKDLSPEGARPKTRVSIHDTLHPGSQRHHHHHHHHVVGGKKNYDQFANCLSRDLLTNAFIQVQEHHEPFVYPRRSSEPLQISDGAALQRLENSIHSFNGKRSQKSMTVEDIGPFEQAWSNEVECYQRNSTGFRDPVLSRFAEELMKANVSIPTLQLVSDCVSTSGSSRSVCSTISSFRDPLLASFEDELLNTTFNRGFSSFKTQISWSKMKGSMCSPRQNESKSKVVKQRVNSLSIESEMSGISGRSGKSNSVALCAEDVSEFAELMAQRIVCEALSATITRVPSLPQDNFNLDQYSGSLAADILSGAIMEAESKCSEWLEQSKMVTWSDKTDCREYSGDSSQLRPDTTSRNGRSTANSLEIENGSSCVEYEDALNFSYTRLEEFADDLACRVLRNSVAITKREESASLRRQYGRPISTGNWGCGAFGGDPQLKSLLQWLAASYAGTPQMIFYTFRHPKMEKFQEVLETVNNRGWDVSQLMQAIRRYCMTAESEMNLTGAVSKDLFTVILQGEVFPGL